MAPKVITSTTIIFLAISAILLFASPSAHSVPEQSGNAVKFAYSGESGPNNWSHLSPSYSLCSEGKRQSPINILINETVPDRNLKPLSRNYHPANVTLINNGHHLELEFEGGVLEVDGKNYSMKQMHWHTPSEHLLDGIQYPAELHLVHKADDGSMAVVGLLYEFGKPDPFVHMIQDGLKELAKDECKDDEVSQVAMGKRSFRLVKRNIRNYYRYIGSLTTPPCTENIVWNVITKPRSISPEQVEALKAPLKPEFKNNGRPVQPLNGRRVEICSGAN